MVGPFLFFLTKNRFLGDLYPRSELCHARPSNPALKPSILLCAEPSSFVPFQARSDTLAASATSYL
jgi:hypothetical protein